MSERTSLTPALVDLVQCSLALETRAMSMSQLQMVPCTVICRNRKVTTGLIGHVMYAHARSPDNEHLDDRSTHEFTHPRIPRYTSTAPGITGSTLL